MNKQELRRLGVLPYEEDTDTSGWMTTQRRRRRRRPPRPIEPVPMPDFEVIRTEVNMPSRRLVARWNAEENRQETVIERVEQINETVQEPIVAPERPPLEELTDDIHPNRTEDGGENMFRRVMRYFR